MNKLFYLIILLFITACSNYNKTYWCGDHPCVNKKEQEAYFKKTMIVEVKNLKKDSYENSSEIKKIMDQALIDEKKRIKKEIGLAKQARLDEKKRIKEEKDIAKQVKLDEKNRIKEEKDLAKQVKLDEKKRIKEEKDLENIIKKGEKKLIEKQKDSKPKKNKTDTVKNDSREFIDLVDGILRKNSFKSYPDINNIPN